MWLGTYMRLRIYLRISVSKTPLSTFKLSHLSVPMVLESLVDFGGITGRSISEVTSWDFEASR